MWKPKRLTTERAMPRLPKGYRIYAVGDIHGRADLLKLILDKIDVDRGNHVGDQTLEIFLGDYIDRGPSSREVIDRLIARSHIHHAIFLKGNHEAFVFDFLKNPAIFPYWRNGGAIQTLMSYGLMPPLNADAVEQRKIAEDFNAALPDSHKYFLSALRSSFTCSDLFFAHAGVRPGIPLTQQREEDLLWIREDFLFSEDDFGKVVIHGHTPVREPDIRRNRINIDTGAYATGRLTCLVIDNAGISFL